MDSKPIIRAYIGPSGSGKTFKALLDIAKYNRQIRIDAQPHGNADLQNGCEVVRTISELFDYVKANKDGPFKACLHPQNIDLKTAFDWVCKIAIIYGKVAILADEANRYIDRHLSKAGEAVFFQSRHSQTRLFYTMFNPRYVTPEMRGNTSSIHLFQSYEENFTSFLQGRGADATTLSRYQSESLPQYSYAVVEMGKKPRIITPKPKPAKSKKQSQPKKGAGRRGKKKTFKGG